MGKLIRNTYILDGSVCVCGGNNAKYDNLKEKSFNIVNLLVFVIKHGLVKKADAPFGCLCIEQTGGDFLSLLSWSKKHLNY